MEEAEKRFAQELLGHTVISKQGKRLGTVNDIIFEVKSGELIHIVLNKPTTYADTLDLERDKNNNVLVPFSAVISMGDFMVISEEDLA